MNVAHYSKCTCINCEAKNCGSCRNCEGKKMFGGNGRNKKRCLLRECLMVNPHAAIFLGPTTSRSSPLGAATAITISDRTKKRKQDHKIDATTLGKRKRGASKLAVSAPASIEMSRKRSKQAKCPGCTEKSCPDCQRDASNRRDVVAEGKPRRKSRIVVEQSKSSAPSLEEKKAPLRLRISLPALADTQLLAPAMSTASSLVADRSAIEVFKLSSYLTQNDDEASQAVDSRKDPTPTTTLYGNEIPPDAPADVCSGCMGARADELDDHPILLCDGPNCGREYHLVCCVPTLSAVPDVDVWLCRDCCPDGSTASLREYFETTDKAKADYQNPKEDYIRYLLRKDSLELKKRNNGVPESELSRGAMIHTLAMCEPNQLARTRGGSEKREALSTDAFLGKPVRLFDTIGNMYHTGRVVESRTKGNDTEFLVRFPAGKEHRKRAYQHWLVPEEHALAVGTAVVWAQIPVGDWKPAILWLRTSRELIPHQHFRKESEVAMGSPSKTKHKVSALARSFGDDIFAMVNVRDQSVDLNNTVATNKYVKDSKNVIQLHMARAELNEQERVRNWRGLQQVDPMGPAVLSSVDYYTLPSLIPTNAGSAGYARRTLAKEGTHASLCPNISLGLDRTKILQMIQQRGILPTKDLAASLSCEIVPVNARTLEVERVGRKSHQ